MMAPKRKLVSLGSSFAAGPGIQPQVLKAAGRSENNYPNLLAKRIDAQLTDLTVSGATLNNLISEPQTASGTTFPPQLDSLPPDADIVTITGGGNDLGYIGSVFAATIQSYFLGWILARFMPSGTQPATAEEVTKRFIAIIDKIRETSPRSQIFLVEYLTLFGRDTKPDIDVAFDASTMGGFQKTAATLQMAYKLAAEARPNCKVVSVADRSQDHALGSREPWVEGFNFGYWLGWSVAPFHPNAVGMKAITEMIYEELSR